MKLSVLKNAGPDTITYYVGDNPEHVKHLTNCTLVCKIGFDPNLDGVNLIHVKDPQLYFYELSHHVEDIYKFDVNDKPIVGHNVEIGPGCVIGRNVIIGNNTQIGANTVIYANTIIGDNVRIDSNVTIGTAGMMWVWKGKERVFLQQLGGVVIEDGCIIGSGCVIVRGSANEITRVGAFTNMAPGCCIGHGTLIGESVHFANNVTVGGGARISSYTFLGSAAVVNAGLSISADDVVVGAGCVVTKNITESGVYAGVPGKKIKETSTKMSGLPKWNR